MIRAGEGDALLEAHHLAIELGERLRSGQEAAAGELAAVIAGLTSVELGTLARSLTRWFQLLNLAEDNDRIRRLRAREIAAAPRPRSGSVREAIHEIARDGIDAARSRSCSRGPRCTSS